MTEIFTNISDNVKQLASTMWTIAAAQKNPLDAAKFLHNSTEYYRHLLTEEEIEFLQFYFNMKMEMILNE